MAQAKRDENSVPTLLGVSNLDQVTPVVIWADPVTHRLLVDSASAGGVTSFAKQGSTALTGAVTISGGTNVTLTQTGQNISIAASGGPPGGSVDDVQLNNGSGGFGGSSLLHFDPNNFELTIASGFISLSNGFLLADVSGTPGIGGNVTAIGGSVSNNGPATGGDAGSLDMTGGDAGGSGTGGNGGSIFISGGVNSSNSSAVGGQGMTIFGVGGASTGTHVGGASGSINLSGDDASASTAGGHGGSLASTANGIRSGGNLDLSAGLTASGGSITATNGGGSINTTGVGSIGLGIAATRTTFQGSATAARTVTLQDVTHAPTARTDSIALTNQGADITSTNFVGASTAGQYRINYVLLDTTADLTAGAVVLTISWTDAAGATTSTATQLLTGVGRTTGSVYLQQASGNVNWATTHTGIFGSAKYALYMTAEKLT